jgi:hypothetical protein
VFPIKSLVGKPEWRDDPNNMDPTKPWWLVIGPAVQSLIEEYPEKKNLITRLFYKANKGISNWAA